MAQKKQDLFLWNKQTSHTKRGQKKDSIQDWIKRVQNESEAAIQEVLGGDVLGKDFSKEIIPDDEAVYEAQELLDGWMKESSFPNLHRELDHRSESWASSTGLILNDEDPSEYDYNNHTMLDGLTKKYLGNDISLLNSDVHTPDNNKAELSDHLYSLANTDDEQIDDALLVHDVLHGMLSKDFTKKIDLGMKPLETIAKNPVPKMNLRHEQVKVRGEKRRQKSLAKKERKLTQEEIAQKARERIVLEEKQRIRLENLEEKAILSEVEKIKLELAEEKQRKEKEEQRKRKILDEAKLQMQLELRKQKEEEKRRKEDENDLRRKAQEEIDVEVVQQLRLNMKMLHKYFTAWYNIVLQRRIRMGKASAIADWKCKVRAWNAWKAYIMCVKSNQQAREIELAMKEKYRKEQMSITHSKNTLLRKCFSSWCRYTHYSVEKKMLLLERGEKAKKMALFLEAASKGELWKEKSTENLKNVAEVASSTNFDVRKEEIEVALKKKCINVEPVEKTESQNTLPIQSKETSCSSNAPAKSRQIERLSKKKKQVGEPSSKKVVKDVPQTRTDQKVHDTCKKGEWDIQTSVAESAVNLSGNVKSIAASEQASSEIGSKLLTDRSDVTSVSSVSSQASRKPQIRSEKQTTKPLHLAMEERQQERKRRKAALEEEKKRKEEERLEVLRAKEAERLRQEQLEKEEKMRQRREEKKLEALKEKEKEFQAEQFRLKNQIARSHYEKVLLRKYGLEPLVRLLQVARLNIQISDKYRNAILSRVCFVEWHVYVKELSCARVDRADECYERILLKRAFRAWLKFRFHFQNMSEIAHNFSKNLQLKHAFNAWQEYVTDQRILTWAKESSSEEHDTKRVLVKCLKGWVRYVKLEKEERQREYRKDEWRKKVQTWLPDYKGGAEVT